MGTKKWSEIKAMSKATDADRAEARAELEAEIRSAGGPVGAPVGRVQPDPERPTGVTRPFSFFHSVEEMRARKTEALAMVGKTISAVRYFSIDFEQFEVAPDDVGPRVITDAGEWARADWSYECGDTVDFGVEIETADGTFYSVVWDPPGEVEGIGIYPIPMSKLLLADAVVAVWDVSTASRWTGALGVTVDDVELAYEQWSATGDELWCPNVVLTIGDSVVRLMLGDISPEGAITPSSTNVVVSFSEHSRG